MMRQLVLLCAALAVAGFGKDIYQPEPQGDLEVGTGVGYAQSLGFYSANGTYTPYSDVDIPYTNTRYPQGFSPAAYGIPFKLKYGLGGGFDVKAEWDAAFTNKDAGDLAGMAEPVLGLKYANSWGGFFTNLTLPYTTGDLSDGKNLPTVIEVGTLARERYHHFRFTGLFSYENDFREDDLVHLSLQPEIIWRKGLDTFLDIDYYQDVHKNLSEFAMTPGIRKDISETRYFDVSAGFTMAGRNAPALWAVKTDWYWTFKT